MEGLALACAGFTVINNANKMHVRSPDIRYIATIRTALRIQCLSPHANMMRCQRVLAICLILVSFDSHPTRVASNNIGPSSGVQVIRACPEDRQNWTPSGNAVIIAVDHPLSSSSLDECKELCKNTKDCIAVKYDEHAGKCAILWKPNDYMNVGMADNVKIGEAVLHVLNCKVLADVSNEKMLDGTHVLSSQHSSTPQDHSE
ncbi:hypothetical protein EG68_08658 [Paragonimus skrjabini miyazakii]|uniref:Apple domain-containing protein n=1 Tax=Paragonimus skrjabini miyazakii TaxID=59628 RepID=A0A8S9YRN9_9TREM|nr:hypothetical protein EG68_08658 [Paragonimus skrjabini miyazakii]